MNDSDPYSGICMTVPGHDESTVLQPTHTLLSNPSRQKDYAKNDEDDFLESLDVQMPPSLFNLPEISYFTTASDSIDYESPIFEESQAEHVSLQSLGYRELSNFEFASKLSRQPKLPREKRQCSSGLESCNSVAFSTLRKLHIHRIAGLCIFQKSPELENVSEPPILDEILKINAEAMQSVGRMLECPCIEKISLCLIACIICNKVVLINLRMLQSEQQGSSTEASNRNCMMPIPDLSSGAGYRQQEQMSQTAVSVGSFKVDPEIARHVRLYVILEDLKRLRAMVERLICRFTDDTITAILQDLLRKIDKHPSHEKIM
ncbi:hypothetical protein EYC80_001663 [Monilinia laxa]|uniref:Aflatoxin regulatory protein domain-containing protein n=1 Tax=Monilinia laxa TaxID=61186 RepID=A0A5N6K5K0_MONLA|nr:hypothetical protein EYC80_001663 [Monilinia laxa]